MKTRSFCTSVLLPLSAILTVILLAGCEPPTPVAPWPMPNQRHQAQPDQQRPVQPDQEHKQCCPPKIIAFGAPWCPACCAGQSKLDALERKGVVVEHVNIDEHPDLATKWGITSIPVYFVIRCGHETVRTQDIDEAVRLMNEMF
jgi:thiol-disulfide isomerase/thioredoxin